MAVRHPESGVPGLDQAAASALPPLHAAARAEALGHVDELIVVQPEKTKELAKEILHAVCLMIASALRSRDCPRPRRGGH